MMREMSIMFLNGLTQRQRELVIGALMTDYNNTEHMLQRDERLERAEAMPVVTVRQIRSDFRQVTGSLSDANRTELQEFKNYALKHPHLRNAEGGIFNMATVRMAQAEAEAEYYQCERRLA